MKASKVVKAEAGEVGEVAMEAVGAEMGVGVDMDVERLDGAEVMFLHTRQLVTNAPGLDVRLFKGGASGEWQEQRRKGIEELAQSIGAGKYGHQLDTVLVVPNGKPKTGEEQQYLVLSGNRRVEGMVIENEKRTAQGQSLLRVRCSVLTTEDPLRDALESNIRRKDLGPMDKAMLIPVLRERYGLGTDTISNKKIGRLLGFGQDHPNQNPVASVIQYEKLLKAPKRVQEDLQLGRIGMAVALELVDRRVVPEGKAEEVLERAKAEQVRAVEERVKGRVEAGELDVDKARAMVERAVAAGKVERPAVEKAIREVQEEVREAKGAKSETPQGASNEATATAATAATATGKTGKVSKADKAAKADGLRPVPWNRKAILDWFEMQDGPANGVEAAPPRVFVRELLGVVSGVGGRKAEARLQEAWDRMVTKAKTKAKAKVVKKPVKTAKTAKAAKIAKTAKPASKPKPQRSAAATTTTATTATTHAKATPLAKASKSATAKRSARASG